MPEQPLPDLSLLKGKAKFLTHKQKRFVSELLKTRNGSEAARRAYDLGSQGGDPAKRQRTAQALAVRQLKKPAVQHALTTLLLKRDFSFQTAVDRLVGEYEGAEHTRDRLEALKIAGRWLGFEKETVLHEGLPLTIHIQQVQE